MLTYQIEKRGELPIYEFLYRSIREDILAGRLLPNSKLPSKRALAEHLGVSVMTVENAYQQLVSEGCVIAKARSGIFVAEVERVKEPLQVHEQIAEDMTHTHKWTLDLTKVKSDVNTFPFSTWAHLTREALSNGGRELLSPIPNQGLMVLRCAIADDLRQRKGMAVSPAQIVVGSGAEYLYLILAQLLGRDSVLAVEDPGYPKIRKIYEKLGVPCLAVPLDTQGVNPKSLDGAAALHISPSHHYPTGLITPLGRRQALLKWAQETNGIIIEDDYDSEFKFSGMPLPTLQSIDSAGKVIYMNTFSQTISPSMRMGFMVLPPVLLKKYKEELDFYSCTVPALEQQVLAEFLSKGHYERHISRMKKIYRTRREIILSAFRKCSFVSNIEEEGAGLHFLLRLNTSESDCCLKKKAESMGVNLSFLSDFAFIPNKSYEHTAVINYGSFDMERLSSEIELLSSIFK